MYILLSSFCSFQLLFNTNVLLARGINARVSMTAARGPHMPDDHLSLARATQPHRWPRKHNGIKCTSQKQSMQTKRNMERKKDTRSIKMRLLIRQPRAVYPAEIRRKQQKLRSCVVTQLSSESFCRCSSVPVSRPPSHVKVRTGSRLSRASTFAVCAEFVLPANRQADINLNCGRLRGGAPPSLASLRIPVNLALL